MSLVEIYPLLMNSIISGHATSLALGRGEPVVPNAQRLKKCAQSETNAV